MKRINEFYSNFPNTRFYKSIHQNYDSNFVSDITYFIDSLINMNVDTIGVFYEEKYDSIGNGDKRIRNYQPPTWTALVQWIDSSDKHQKSLEYMGGCYSSRVFHVEDCIIISYYLANRSDIDSSYIMPDIPELNRNRMIISSGGLLQYCKLFCLIGTQNTYFEYSRSAAYNSHNLFRERNLNSPITKWADEILKGVWP